jgi:predicted TIM-barrel fold metal-dependent hydrolase
MNRIVDADSHVNEPADVWQRRVPEPLREFAPTMIDVDGDRVGWSFEKGKRVRRVATACAGFDVTTYHAKGARWSEIRPGSYDPEARLLDMELDMIYAQVIYPSLVSDPTQFSEDRDLQIACVRAYNDWLHEFCSLASDRLIGIPLAPSTGLKDVIEEWERIADRGDRGYLIAGFPNGGDKPTPEDDQFWKRIDSWRYPVHLHFGFTRRVGGSAVAGEADGLSYITTAALLDMGVAMFAPIAGLVYSGLFERFPDIKLVAVEAGIGWIPHFCHHLDDNFLRRRFRADVHLAHMPSEYVRRNIWATFVEDPHGVRSRHEIGVDRIMWSTDYPHTNSNWPNSQQILAYELRDVCDSERDMILWSNAARLYGIVGK